MRKYVHTFLCLLVACIMLVGCSGKSPESSRHRAGKGTSTNKGGPPPPPSVIAGAPKLPEKKPQKPDEPKPSSSAPDKEPQSADAPGAKEPDATDTPDGEPDTPAENSSDSNQETEKTPDKPEAKKILTAEEAKAEIIKLGGRVKTNESGNVTAVFLNRSNAKDEALEMLQFLPEVTVLNVTGLDVTDESVENLAKMPKLERLYPAQTKISEEGLGQLLKDKPELKVLK